MSLRVLVLTLIALVAAVGTTMMVRSWIAAERAAMRLQKTDVPGPPISEVVVAAEALPAGLVLKSQHVKWQPWPKESIHEGYFVRGNNDLQEVVGSVARSAIAPGEPLLETRVVRPGDRGFLAAILTPGMRAVSVPINATSGIAGLIFPGDRVDIILTHALDGNNAENERVRRASETVLETIRVLAIDNRTEHEADSSGSAGKTATLEVIPKQAEILAVVTELGRLSLSLRSLQIPETASGAADTAQQPDENAKRGKQSYTLDSNVSVLLDRPAAQGRDKPGWQVKVVRGSKVHQVTSQGVMRGPSETVDGQEKGTSNGAAAATISPTGR